MHESPSLPRPPPRVCTILDHELDEVETAAAAKLLEGRPPVAVVAIDVDLLRVISQEEVELLEAATDHGQFEL